MRLGRPGAVRDVLAELPDAERVSRIPGLAARRIDQQAEGVGRAAVVAASAGEDELLQAMARSAMATAVTAWVCMRATVPIARWRVARPGARGRDRDTLARGIERAYDRSTMSQDPQTFEEFWPFYVGEHKNPVNRALHYAGHDDGDRHRRDGRDHAESVVAPGVTPVAGYSACVWIGHFVFEKNMPATFKHPIWSLAADFKMYGLALRGKMAEELERRAAESELHRGAARAHERRIAGAHA